MTLTPITRPIEAAAALWRRLRDEAEQACAESPLLAPLFLGSVLHQPDLASAIFHRVAVRLDAPALPRPVLERAFRRAAIATPVIEAGFCADLLAVVERDPACLRILEPVLYFKGFHALQTHRLAHWLWHCGERDFALYLQSRASEVLQTDIHPAARIGSGILLDHATGLVIGATTVIEDAVSLLQGVTLGGTGHDGGDRHPKIRRGVIIGAGATILGPIEVGAGARVAAGSVVLAPVPPRTTVAGVPARIVRRAAPGAEALSGDEILREVGYNAFDYNI
ncbi:serine O-acetyltransferase [Roseomonas sp. 18066]|uniref:serine O-acetyltransferase n=1 Tax=Roseomonas sp. 18066 TaxID=2681412 RepID=UPI00190F53F9|nr:serine O-acetyltransferase [Roseomonas sp. 18066]